MTIDLWDLERRLWIEGQDAFAELMDMQAVMIFPEPIGILYDGNILSEVEIAPSWCDVAMTDRIRRQRDKLVILNYRAEACRAGAKPYRAMCTSIWQEAGTGPRIVGHQQTPSDKAVDYPFAGEATERHSNAGA